MWRFRSPICLYSERPPNQPQPTAPTPSGNPEPSMAKRTHREPDGGAGKPLQTQTSQPRLSTTSHHTPGQMLDRLGLAETTPGPLILVLQ